jgi:hypothetical protein
MLFKVDRQSSCCFIDRRGSREGFESSVAHERASKDITRRMKYS